MVAKASQKAPVEVSLPSEWFDFHPELTVRAEDHGRERVANDPFHNASDDLQ